jgi:predicted nucleic acid-binding protein
MNVIVDTSVWSLALRKKTLTDDELSIVNELKELLYELRVILIGPIRQELLSGISDEVKFNNLREKMRAFDDIETTTADYERAAEIHNTCRRNRIQGSHIDYLICSVAQRHSYSIFTTDSDFESYKNIIDLKLHTMRK